MGYAFEIVNNGGRHYSSAIVEKAAAARTLDSNRFNLPTEMTRKILGCTLSFI